ncbi:MAG: patatin-like phospholipase family protein [Candidatus Sulfopaludibacter sp.]|nr:patatin-like phospholipase family protein [Candidatus Sulfopaludibacter sp.]
MVQRALVLGAGGHAAAAWEIGLITGLSESGVDVRNADLFVGTSAGARVAVQITAGLTLEELFQRQIDPRRQQTEAPPGVDWRSLRGEFTRAKEGGGGEKEILRRFGTVALTGAKGPASERKQFIEGQLPVHTWPEQKLLIATVEAEAGERRVFDRASGIDLIDAVTASGAVAGIWPAVEFAGRHYFDGGFYSTDNADLAIGSERVLIAALRAGSPPLAVRSLGDAVERLRSSGARVEVVHPDEATEAAYAAVGGNLLDPAVCEPAALAGRAQGERIAGQIAGLWY